MAEDSSDGPTAEAVGSVLTADSLFEVILDATKRSVHTVEVRRALGDEVHEDNGFFVQWEVSEAS